MPTLRQWLERLYGVMHRRRINIAVGEDSSIGWFRLRGQRGRIHIGEGSIVRARIDFDSADGMVVIGNRCFVGASHLVCHTRIEIGSDVIVSWGVTIVDHDSHSLQWQHRQHDVPTWMRGEKDWTDVRIAPVMIGDRVWIGFGVSILRGVSIGAGSVVGACSVVTKDVPANVVVAGNPARVLRSLDDVRIPRRAIGSDHPTQLGDDS